MSVFELGFIRQAIGLSRRSADAGEFPAGSLVVRDGAVLATATSQTVGRCDPSAHADVVALRDACRAARSHDLSGAVLFSSLEACILCFGAASWAGIGTLVYALPKASWMVERGYFEGEHDLRELNARSTRPIELVHVAAAEQRALSVLTEWDRRQPGPDRAPVARQARQRHASR